MKIVIDIPKEDYLKLIETDENGEKEIPLGLLLSLWDSLLDSVKYKCTQLPKKHGRLIDAKDATETLQIMFAGDEDIQNACGQCISDCPTIIESESEEDNA